LFGFRADVVADPEMGSGHVEGRRTKAETRPSNITASISVPSSLRITPAAGLLASGRNVLNARTKPMAPYCIGSVTREIGW